MVFVHRTAKIVSYEIITRVGYCRPTFTFRALQFLQPLLDFVCALRLRLASPSKPISETKMVPGVAGLVFCTVKQPKWGL